MPALTSSQIRNYVRRALREVVDPSPDKATVTEIWTFFQSQCAYCGAQLDRTKKEGHIDHLVPSSKAGANHCVNRVLSCANCNEKEKLDRDWEEFLHAKNPASSIFATRKALIMQWQAVYESEAAYVHPDLLRAATNAADEINELFLKRFAALREMNHGFRAPTT